jgi:aminoglycoside N3'-acetyltransferase
MTQTQQGLFYPLTVTASGDVQIATTLTEDLVQSWARYLLDTEASFDLFETVGSAVTAEQLERFSYALRTKCPAVSFAITGRWERRVLIIDVAWREGSTLVEVAFNG